jgi:hypothetical protein
MLEKGHEDAAARYIPPHARGPAEGEAAELGRPQGGREQAGGVFRAYSYYNLLGLGFRSGTGLNSHVICLSV